MYVDELLVHAGPHRLQHRLAIQHRVTLGHPVGEQHELHPAVRCPLGDVTLERHPLDIGEPTRQLAHSQVMPLGRGHRVDASAEPVAARNEGNQGSRGP